MDLFKEVLFAGLAFILQNNLPIESILELKQDMKLKEMLDQHPRLISIPQRNDNYFTFKEIAGLLEKQEAFQK